MNKFLTFDERIGIHRLPMSYSLGDLDTIRNIFGRYSQQSAVSLPLLPPFHDEMKDDGSLGFLVYPPSKLSSHLIDFLEKAVVHVRELKGKGYDYQHPLFKNYLSARQDTVAYMAECLEKVVSQERRLGIFNLFWLVVTKQLVNLQDEVLVKSSASANLRFLIHPHLKSLLNQVLEQVYEKLNITDGVTRKKIPFYPLS